MERTLNRRNRFLISMLVLALVIMTIALVAQASSAESQGLRGGAQTRPRPLPGAQVITSSQHAHPQTRPRPAVMTPFFDD